MSTLEMKYFFKKDEKRFQYFHFCNRFWAEERSGKMIHASLRAANLILFFYGGAVKAGFYLLNFL